MLSQTQLSQVRQEVEIMFGGLAKPEPWVEDNPIL
jgi:hypothetical protein